MPENVTSERPNHQLQAYVLGVSAIGAGIIIESLVGLRTTAHPFAWLLFAALAMLTGSFSMKIASVSASVSVSDTFFISTALLFGPAPATLAVALDSCVVSWRRRHAPMRRALNTVTPALGMWAGSHVFFWLARVPPLAQAHASMAQLALPLLALTAVYFLMNSGLIAVAIGLDARKPPLQIWHQHFLWLSVHSLAAASLSFCLVMLINQVISLSAVLIVLPLLVVLHLTLRSSFGRLEDARSHLARIDRLYMSTVETLAMAIDAKDDVTHSHVRRVQSYALGLAKALDVHDEPTLRAIEAAALLHDTGKLAVPEHILNKPGKLTPAEFEKMKRHVDIGADILSLVDFPYPVEPIVRCHHENWDGSGYPRGVVGEQIPIGARILSVVDCYDALTSDRPYRSALTTAEAFDILRDRSGTMYEPRVVETFIRVHNQIAKDVFVDPAHQQVLQQISQVNADALDPAAPSSNAAGAVPDDLLLFARLARLASGDAVIGDMLALATRLLPGVPADATVAWYIVDEQTQRLRVAEASGPAGIELRDTSIGIGEGLSGWVAAHRRAMLNSEAALDLGDRATAVTPPLASCLSVPLISGDTVVGALTLYSPARSAFTEDQSRLLQLLAPHAAQAISRALRHGASLEPSAAPSAKAAGAELRLVRAG